MTVMDKLTQLNPKIEYSLISAFKQAEDILLENTDSTAKLQINLLDGGFKEVMFVKVEGRWIPQEMSLEWPRRVANARSQLEAIDPEQIAKQKLKIISSRLYQLRPLIMD